MDFYLSYYFGSISFRESVSMALLIHINKRFQTFDVMNSCYTSKCLLERFDDSLILFRKVSMIVNSINFFFIYQIIIRFVCLKFSFVAFVVVKPPYDSLLNINSIIPYSQVR